MFVTLLPTLMLNESARDRPVGNRDYAGWILWLVGMFFEAIADMQKSSFRSNLDNQVRKRTFHSLSALPRAFFGF